MVPHSCSLRSLLAFLGLQGAPGPAAPPGAGGKNNNQMVFMGQLLAEACCGKSRSRCCIQPSVKRAKGKGERCSVGCVAPRMLVWCPQGLGTEGRGAGRRGGLSVGLCRSSTGVGVHGDAWAHPSLPLHVFPDGLLTPFLFILAALWGAQSPTCAHGNVLTGGPATRGQGVAPPPQCPSDLRSWVWKCTG